MKYWLIKSEPDDFSFSDLMASENQTTMWDGVRNYQARNFMRDGMNVGDKVFYYHSNIPEPGIVGVAQVASEPYPDPTQFDPDSKYFDPKSGEDNPRWLLVDFKGLYELPRTVTLAELKQEPKLADMRLVQRGNRLSVMPVTEEEFEHILKLAGDAEQD